MKPTAKPYPNYLNSRFSQWLNTVSVRILWYYVRLAYQYEVQGMEHYHHCKSLTPSGGFILASNHQASMDIPFLVASIPWGLCVAFMAKQELFKHPLANWYFSVTGTIPVNRTQLEKSTIKAAKLALSTPNWMMAIFPEGTRGEAGTVSSVKAGTTFLSKLCGSPILPAGIALGNNGKGFRPKVRIVIKPPILCEATETLEDYTARFQAILQTARTEAQALL